MVFDDADAVPRVESGNGALLEYLVSEPRLRCVHRLVHATDLCVELVENPWTVLAPLDVCFQRDELERWIQDREATEALFDLCHSLLIRGAVDLEREPNARCETLLGTHVHVGPRWVYARFRAARIVDTVRLGPSVVHLLDGLLEPSPALETRMTPADAPR